MGCVSSKEEPAADANAPEAREDKRGDDDETEVEDAAKKQRRRLSVAPQHVGDISKAAGPLMTPDEEEDKKQRDLTLANLTEVERKAMGNYKFAMRSKKGIVPYNRNKVNQDRALLKFALGDDASISLFGVMDGHGEFGHQVAAFVQEQLPKFLAAEDLKSDPERLITLAVQKMCEKLAQTSINVAFSGTTAIFSVQIDKRLYVCNIGDSRCVMCRQRPDGELEAIGLSVDQKPDDPKEKARILKAGGRVEPLPGNCWDVFAVCPSLNLRVGGEEQEQGRGKEK